MRLLVCGGAGFIGSNFIHYMLGKHATLEVLNFDKLTYAGNLNNLSDLASHTRYRFSQGDITDAVAVDQACAEFQPEAIINFAAETHVDRSIHLGSREFVMTNVVGTQTLLDAVRRHGIKKMVQVSTDEVYGELTLDDARKFTESTSFSPNVPYAAAKAGGDLLCRAYFETFGVPVVVSHCSNNYGPYQFPEKFIPQAIFKAMNNEPIPMYGDGLYVRDWIYVIDHAMALDALLERGIPGQVYNIGADNERNNLTVAKMILRMLGKTDDLMVEVPDRPGHDRRYAVDASKIHQELSWQPEYTAERFEEGLRETVTWYQRNITWVQKLRNRQNEINTHIKLNASSLSSPTCSGIQFFILWTSLKQKSVV